MRAPQKCNNFTIECKKYMFTFSMDNFELQRNVLLLADTESILEILSKGRIRNPYKPGTDPGFPVECVPSVPPNPPL